ncbi:MAG: isoleucine--tRNA ligase [Rickettsiales bacterium]|nr:isoleucine--tRNA ligase [Rickettsiales bacterium]
MSDQNIYPKTDGNPDFNKIDEEILEFWSKQDSFNKSVENREFEIDGKNNEFIFYDGPPFANGLPHYGHLLTGFVKDLFARYKTIQGQKCERRFGWDTHGLPVEMESEKELGISGQIAIAEFGIEKFNQNCRKSVMKYSDDWQEYVTRQARWVDFDNGYKTMDLSYMESVIWAFGELYKKGYIYEDYRVMPYSWACETPLSNFETRMDNSYRMKESKALTIIFEIKNSLQITDIAKPCYFMAWTTTPWTLPSNLALAVHNDIDYAVIELDDKIVIFAENLITKFQKDLSKEGELNIIKIVKGSELVSIQYKPLFDYLEKSDEYDLSNAFQVLSADFVNVEEGTGIVHLASGFGEDDQLTCKANDIPTVCPIDSRGRFTHVISDFAGIHVFDTNIDIIKRLKEQGNWIKTEQYLHNYPHCWRTDTPLIYKAVPSWYVKVTAFKDKMIELNQEINWIPDHIKDGQFGKWLENSRDWSITRNRFWGCPVPVWRSDNPEYPRIDVYGSLDDLERDFGVRPKDLHRPHIDNLTRPNPDDPTGKSTMRRVTDVLDCWFESGSMPYASVHYPFENKEWFEEHCPADFIVEYVAQTRGWFYTMLVLSTALFEKAPFKNCICHGVILDDKSQKLSKRLKNYTSPLELFKKYGSDSMRWFMCASTVMRGNELNIDKEGNVFKDTLRLEIKPIWNSYNFFTLYANADGIKAEFDLSSENVLDRYIISKAHEAIRLISQHLDNYDTVSAYKAVHDFFEVLNNWYIRRNRNRFWKTEKDQDKISAYNTLYSVLNEMVKAMSPLVPFLAEKIYQGLNSSLDASVHLADYPDHKIFPFDAALTNVMDLVLDICNIAHSIRSKHNIRVRQPLRSIKIIMSNPQIINDFKDLILDEVNVKDISFVGDISEVADYSLQLNFKILGAKLGPKMKEIAGLAKGNNWKKLSDGNIEIGDEVLTQEDYSIVVKPKIAGEMISLTKIEGLVSLDIELDDDLVKEGYARDVVRLIQQDRKEADFNVTDRISIEIASQSEIVKSAIAEYSDYIKDQTLGDELTLAKDNDLEFTYQHELDNAKLQLNVSKQR